MKVFSTAFFILVTLFALVPASTAQEVPPQASGLNPGSRASDAAPGSVTDDRYIVYFRQYGPQAPASVRAAGGAIVYEFPQYSAIAARLPNQALRALQNDPNVQRIEADPRRYPLALNDTPLGTGETRPYGIEMVQAHQLADANAGTRKVCIIDSGYHAAHLDLQDGSITTSPDSGTGDPLVDKSGHGTHVAGTIAALGGNGVGVVGTLPGGNIKLHIVKVFGDDGKWAYSSTLAAAVGKCRDNLSSVISMSLGGGSPSTLEQNVFDAAYNNGVLSIAAAGNGGNTSTLYPAGYASVISVAAVDNTETLASFSQRNADVELAAPGVQVLSTVPWNEANTLTVGGVVYQGNWIEFASRSRPTSGTLVNGGLCDATSSWSGKVVLCERGSVTFFSKVNNVTAGGGVAAVIYNNATGNFFGTLGAGNTSTIPAISLTQADGQFLVDSKLGSAGTVVSVSENPGSGYEKWDGTSMATPHVSGVAALVWSYNPAWTNDQIRQALQATAKDLGAAGRDNSYGYGLVQAKAALCYLQPSESVCGGPDTTPPTVTINQAGGQADPTNASPINFTVVFSETVTGFATGDLTLSGTAGATTATVTGSGATYNVAVSGMTGDGTVVASLLAGVAQDAAGNGNTASTSTDNTVTYDTTPPSVTINQAGAQADPTNASPINFSVVFSEPVTGFTSGDVTLGGTAGATTATATGSGTTYTVAVSGMVSSGTVIASIPVGVAQDAAGNLNTASTSTDNSVTYDPTSPSVTINQAGGQADPTSASPINFTAVFSEPVTGFATGDVTLNGTAGATTATVTGSGTTYNVAVSGMTREGTVVASILAGVAQDAALNGNTTSTITDNTVTYTVPLAPLCLATVNSSTDTNPTGGGTVTINWSNSGAVTQVKVQRQKSDGTWSTRATVNASTVTWAGSDTGSDPQWRLVPRCGGVDFPGAPFDP